MRPQCLQGTECEGRSRSVALKNDWKMMVWSLVFIGLLLAACAGLSGLSRPESRLLHSSKPPVGLERGTGRPWRAEGANTGPGQSLLPG